jgi:hypothetical protein
VELAISVDSLGGLRGDELAACVARLHELGVPALYSVNRESTALRAALTSRYWLRDMWVPARWVAPGEGARKPDPTTGPVERPPGSYRHVVGRRRLLPASVRGQTWG